MVPVAPTESDPKLVTQLVPATYASAQLHVPELEAELKNVLLGTETEIVVLGAVAVPEFPYETVKSMVELGLTLGNVEVTDTLRLGEATVTTVEVLLSLVVVSDSAPATLAVVVTFPKPADRAIRANVVVFEELGATVPTEYAQLVPATDASAQLHVPELSDELNVVPEGTVAVRVTEVPVALPVFPTVYPIRIV